MTKKRLVAMLLGAGCASAQAEGPTIYGSLDGGIGTVNNVLGQGRVTGLHNGGMSSSRLGFKGAEDIGGGNAIIYLLESDVFVDTGSTGSGPLFGRSAWVGAKGKWGELRLGRNYTETYELAAKYDPMSGGNFGGMMQVFDSRQSSLNPTSGNMFSSYGSARVDNSIHYRTPVMAGFVGRITYAAGENVQSSKTGSVRTVSLEYTQGPFEAAAVFGQMYSPASPALVFRHKAAYLRYKFDLARLVAGHTESEGLGAGGGRFVTNFLGANVPVGPSFAVNAFLARVDNEVFDEQPVTWTLRADYFLSKRSMLYAGYAASRQDDASRLNIVNLSKFSSSSGAGNQPNPGDDQTGFMVGLRHVF
jgi:predicted porin